MPYTYCVMLTVCNQDINVLVDHGEANLTTSYNIVPWIIKKYQENTFRTKLKSDFFQGLMCQTESLSVMENT